MRAQVRAIKRKPERIMLRVRKGALVPAYLMDHKRLRDRKYSIDDVLAAVLTKPRNPKFHRLVHGFGDLCANNIDAFCGMESHTILKRLQIEGDIACDHIALNFPGVGPVIYRQAQSLSFESMDQAVFSKTFRQFCDYVSRRYWPDLSPEKIAAMAEIMSDEPT